MKKIAMFTAALFAVSMTLSAGAMAREGQPYGTTGAGQATQQEQTLGAQPGMAQQQQQVKNMDDLKQFSINDQQGMNIGQIDQVLVDVQRGQIGYVLVTSEGAQKRVIPWNALQADPQQQTLTLQISADRFEQAPTGDAQMVQDMEQARQIHQFYGVSPYWEDSEMQRQPMLPPGHPTLQDQGMQQQDMQRMHDMHQQQQQPVQRQ